jgi:sarcosine oxidase subunit alpha
MEVNGIPGVPTCITPLEAGMDIRHEDFRPFFAPLFSAAARRIPLPAGFYYRIFTRPTFLNSLFAKSVRRMAGVGRLTMGADTARFAESSEVPSALDAIRVQYDIVIVGAGISGMSAALSAADFLSPHGRRPVAAKGRTGDAQSEDYGGGSGGMEVRQDGARSILLVDEYPSPGGHSTGHQRDSELLQEAGRLGKSARTHPAIEYAPAVIAQGLYPPSTLLLAARGGSLDSPGRMTRVSARAFVFAAGANDTLPLFENNSLPGIFGAGAIRLLLERDGYEFDGPAVVYGTGDRLVETVSLLNAAGVDVAAIVDAAADSPQDQNSGGLPEGPNAGNPTQSENAGDVPAGIRRIKGARLVSAAGRDWIRSAVFHSRDGGGVSFTLPCALLCIAFRGQGAYELPYQAGFEFCFSKAGIVEEKILLPRETERRHESGTAFYLAGGITGESNWRNKIEQGKQAGAKAAAAVQAMTKNGDVG